MGTFQTVLLYRVYLITPSDGMHGDELGKCIRPISRSHQDIFKFTSSSKYWQTIRELGPTLLLFCIVCEVIIGVRCSSVTLSRQRAWAYCACMALRGYLTVATWASRALVPYARSPGFDFMPEHARHSNPVSLHWRQKSDQQGQ